MPRTVPEKLAEYARDWGDLGVKAWNRGWWELPVEVGNEIAPLINAGAGEVVMMPNVTIAQSAVLSSVDFSGSRDTIVMTALDFPSVLYMYEELARIGEEAMNRFVTANLRLVVSVARKYGRSAMPLLDLVHAEVGGDRRAAMRRDLPRVALGLGELDPPLEDLGPVREQLLRSFPAFETASPSRGGGSGAE